MGIPERLCWYQGLVRLLPWGPNDNHNNHNDDGSGNYNNGNDVDSDSDNDNDGGIVDIVKTMEQGQENEKEKCRKINR